MVVVYITLFEQFIERGANQVEENISKRLHDHFFLKIISDLPFDLHQTCLRFLVKSGVGAWLFTHPMIFFSNWLHMFSSFCCALG